MSKKYILLFIQQQYEDRLNGDAYAIPANQRGKEFVYLKAAIREYLETSLGQMAIRETGGEFNWSDVRPYVPLHFWAEKSIFPLTPEGNGPYSMSNYSFSDFIIKNVEKNERLA